MTGCSGRARGHEPITDVGGEIKVATVTDPFGNLIGIIENPHFKVAASDSRFTVPGSPCSSRFTVLFSVRVLFSVSGSSLANPEPLNRTANPEQNGESRTER
jgi:hypothetical protein